MFRYRLPVKGVVFLFSIANCGLIIFVGLVIGNGLIGRGYGYVACGLYLVYVLISLYV